MAKRILTKKKTKPKLTAETNRLVNAKYLGKIAPSIDDRIAFLNWCPYMVDAKQARRWLDEYLELTGRTVPGIPDRWLNLSVCYRARLKTLGAPFTEEQDFLLEKGVADILKHAGEDTGATGVARPTIRDHIREKFSDVMGELEGLIDDGFLEDMDIEAWYRKMQVSPTIASMILKKLTPRLDEVLETCEGKDPQLNEAYARVDEDEFFLYKESLHALVDTTQRMIDNQKKAMAPRKPKPVSVEKKLKHLTATYQKFSKDFNVQSIDPAKIIGAQELWTLNTKYKLLTVYRAESHGGQLDVARCKVIGFNRNDSHTYRLGRKAEALVDSALKSSKAAMKKVISGLKEAPLQERINENTILLRV